MIPAVPVLSLIFVSDHPLENSMIQHSSSPFPQPNRWPLLAALAAAAFAPFEVGAFYWTGLVPDIVNPGREGQDSFSV